MMDARTQWVCSLDLVDFDLNEVFEPTAANLYFDFEDGLTVRRTSSDAIAVAIGRDILVNSFPIELIRYPNITIHSYDRMDRNRAMLLFKKILYANKPKSCILCLEEFAIDGATGLIYVNGKGAEETVRKVMIEVNS